MKTLDFHIVMNITDGRTAGTLPPRYTEKEAQDYTLATTALVK